MTANLNSPAAPPKGQGCMVVFLIFIIMAVLGSVFGGEDDSVDPSRDYPSEYQPSDETDRMVQEEVRCLEDAYARYEANPSAFPGYSNELDYANALCDR